MAQKKIDLRSRLNKAGGTGTGSAPPGGIPAPAIPSPSVAIPPPAVTGGIPMPPFATPSAPASAPSRPPPPTVDPNDTFAAVRPSGNIVAAAPVAVTVDEGAIQEATSKVKKYIPIAAVGGTIAGLLIGYIVGGGSARSSQEQVAIKGASLMMADVEKSNAKIKELAEKIKAAAESIKAKKFPENFATELGGLNIPFDGQKLMGRSIGSYDGQTQQLLFQYLADVEALNDNKDKIQRIFAGQKQRITDALAANDKPKVNYSVIVIKNAKGNPMASIVPVPEAFDSAGDWPKTYKFVNPVNRQAIEATRYESGEPMFSDTKKLALPVDPGSVSATFPSDVVTQIVARVVETGALINGGDGEDASPGLIKTGDALINNLKKIAAKGN